MNYCARVADKLNAIHLLMHACVHPPIHSKNLVACPSMHACNCTSVHSSLQYHWSAAASKPGSPADLQLLQHLLVVCQPVLLLPPARRLALSLQVTAVPALHPTITHALHTCLGLTPIPRLAALRPAAKAGALTQAPPWSTSCQLLGQA